MNIKWANGRVQIDMDEETEAKPLLVWLQLIGVMVPNSIQHMIRHRLEGWFSKRFDKPSKTDGTE